MLRIVIPKNKEIAWHASRAPIRDVLADNMVSVYDVIEVEADGPELALIKSLVGASLPVFDPAKVPVQSWYGDHAKFIVGNLPSDGCSETFGQKLTLEQLSDTYIAKVLASTKSLTEAAKVLDINQATLFRWRKKNGLDKESTPA